MSAQPASPTSPVSAKIVISGGFGVGKTTLISTISEITPLHTEAAMTTAGIGVDDREFTANKTTTTVALDFGRVTVNDNLRLYLFGTPGQERFGFMWDDLIKGALGALVLTDTRRMEACYQSIDYYESRAIPFVVAVNQFEDGPLHRLDQGRQAGTDPLRSEAMDQDQSAHLIVGMQDVE